MSAEKHNISKTSNQRSSDDAEEALWWQLRGNDTRRGQPRQIQSNVNGLVNQLKIYSSVADTQQSRAKVQVHAEESEFGAEEAKWE